MQEHHVRPGAGPLVVVNRESVGQGDALLVEGARRWSSHRLIPPGRHSTVRRVSPHAYTVPAQVSERRAADAESGAGPEQGRGSTTRQGRVARGGRARSRSTQRGAQVAAP